MSGVGELARPSRPSRFLRALKRDIHLYIMTLPALALLLLLRYVPMYGVLIAFEKFNFARGVFGSRWVGLANFVDWFRDPYFWRVTRNTLLLGLYSLIFGFPAPIILALSFNELHARVYKRVTQTISYLPYFVSTVIIVGIIIDFCDVETGKINDLFALLGLAKVNFMAKPEWFRPLYIISGIWQGVGWGAIIYLAALAGVDVEQYEAATLDGATRMQKMRHVSIPAILPTVTILFIFAVGGILGSDFTKILLMYRPLTYETADVISTYIYRAGIEGASYSFSTAVGLFNSLISFVFLAVTNLIAKRTSEVSLW